jgi:hypothetical protein
MSQRVHVSHLPQPPGDCVVAKTLLAVTDEELPARIQQFSI